MSEKRQGVQSVVTAMHLLHSLAAIGRPATLSELAAAAGMAPAKAHRYLVSLIEGGMVEQGARAESYKFGPAAISIGIAALRQNDFAALARPRINAIRDRANVSCFAAVFGNKGPTVIQQAEAAQSVSVHVRPGSVLPLARSATGRAFAAWLPEETLAPFLKDEGVAAKEMEEHLDAVRRTGLAIIRDTLLPGISAVAAPVFDRFDGALLGVFTALGPSGSIDVAADGPVATTIRAVIEEMGALLIPRAEAPAEARKDS